MGNLDFLDEYLSSDNSIAAMELSELDGFLTGIACSPEPILSSEWMQVVWGSAKPLDSATHRKAIQLILARYNQIVDGLAAEPPHIEPIFWQSAEGHIVASDWCEGFMKAYTSRIDLWMDLIRTQAGQDLLFPILAHLFDEDGKPLMDIPDEEIEPILSAASKEIGTNVPVIYTFWQSKRRKPN